MATKAPAKLRFPVYHLISDGLNGKFRVSGLISCVPNVSHIPYVGSIFVATWTKNNPACWPPL